MPAPRKPRPHGFVDRPFTVKQADAQGLTRAQVRGIPALAPTAGLRMPGPPPSVEAYAAAYALVLPAPWAYSHVTAARLHGLPLPSRWSPSEPLDVMRSRDAPVRRPGVRARYGLERRRPVVVRGLPVTDVATTWCDLAGQLELDDLVVLGDAELRRRAGAGGRHRIEDLRAAHLLCTGGRGAKARARALELVRVGSESPGETRARLLFLRAGLPEPELNVDVGGAERWVARVDFLWAKQKVVVEYEGDHHRTDRAQWQWDIHRVRELEALGYRVVRMTGADLRDPVRREALLALLRSLLCA